MSEPVCGNCGLTADDHEEIEYDGDYFLRCADGNLFRSETDEDRASLRAAAMEGGL